MLEFTEEELTKTIRRAGQIAQQQESASSLQTTPESYEAYLRAAEEAGISREAMWLALSEQFMVPMDAMRVGELVFAPAADQSLYVATVKEVEGTTSLVVEFEAGGRQRVALADVRALALIPGREIEFAYDVVMAELPGIWRTGKVLAYDPAGRQATISLGAAAYEVPLSKLRLGRTKRRLPVRMRDFLLRAVFIAGGIGTGVGFLLGHFLR